MAFSAQEKVKLLFLLGYSGFEDDGPAMRAMNSLDSREATMGPIIRDLVTKIDAVFVEIQDLLGITAAVQDGSIHLRQAYALGVQRSIGRQHVANLGRFTKVAVIEDIFSDGGRVNNASSFYSGDPSEKRINPAVGAPTRIGG